MNNSIKLCLLLVLLSVGLKAQVPVANDMQFITNIAQGNNIVLTSDIDLTGQQSLLLTSRVTGNGFTIHYTELPKEGEVFLFMMNGGMMENLRILGPNGNVMGDGGFFGAVRVLENGGTFNNVIFENCDKFGIYNNGVRAHQNDIAYVNNCTFKNIKRLGYGYGIWTQYGYSIVRNSTFSEGRHAVDGSSEANQYDIQGCIFEASFYNYAIHLHEYGGGRSGAGFVFKHNYVFGKVMPIDIHPPHSGETIIDSNFFEADFVGLNASNKIAGVGMLPAPMVTKTVSYKVNQSLAKLPAKGYDEIVFPDGEGNRQSKLPRVKTFSAYGTLNGIRSLTGYHTVSITDTGKYTGMMVKCFKATIEVYRNGVLIDKIDSPEWTYWIYYGAITFKVVGESGGECYIDDWVKSSTSETFEATNKIKVNGYQGTIKTGRFAGEAASGLFSFKFTFVSNGSVNLE